MSALTRAILLGGFSLTLMFVAIFSEIDVDTRKIMLFYFGMAVGAFLHSIGGSGPKVSNGR